jgi:hypothetical protein
LVKRGRLGGISETSFTPSEIKRELYVYNLIMYDLCIRYLVSITQVQRYLTWARLVTVEIYYNLPQQGVNDDVVVRYVRAEVEAHLERVVVVRHDAEQRHEAVRHQLQLRVAGDDAPAHVRLARVEQQALRSPISTQSIRQS